MRIAYLTAGTNHYYCGTCLRDQTLVRGLRALGDEAFLVPLYLPQMAEIPESEKMPLFLGGVRVYLQHKSALFRSLPYWLSRFLDDPWLLDRAARMSAMTDPADLGDLTLSMLEGLEGSTARELERLMDWLAREGRADAVCLSNALLLGLAPAIKARLGLPVLCSLQGEESFVESFPEPQRSRCWQRLGLLARGVDALVPVSRWYGERMAKRLAVDEKAMTVIHAGLELDEFRPSRCRAPILGFLSQLTPAKGLHRLVDAFLELKKGETLPGLRLHVAGSRVPGFDAFVDEQVGRISEAGFAEDFLLECDLSREAKIDFLSKLSVFSVPATYGEAFGLYVLEALASALPVVQPRHAAFPEILEKTGGGLLYDPEDPAALARTLEPLLGDGERARTLGRVGRKAVLRSFSAEAMSRPFHELLVGLRERLAFP